MKTYIVMLSALCSLGAGSSLSAQEMSNRWTEYLRIEKGKERPFTDTFRLVRHSATEYLWQKNDGLAYRGTLENERLDLLVVQYGFKEQDNGDVLLISGNTEHYLKRAPKASVDNNMDYVLTRLPESVLHVWDTALLNESWVVYKRLGANGQIYRGPVTRHLYDIKSQDGRPAVYTIDKRDQPTWTLSAIREGALHLTDTEGHSEIYKMYKATVDELIISNEEQTVYYYLRKQNL